MNKKMAEEIRDNLHQARYAIEDILAEVNTTKEVTRAQLNSLYSNMETLLSFQQFVYGMVQFHQEHFKPVYEDFLVKIAHIEKSIEKSKKRSEGK
jgi:hypothetical protein